MDYENLAFQVLNNNSDLILSLCDENKVDYTNLYLVLFGLCNDKTGLGNQYINTMTNLFTRNDVVFIRSGAFDLDNLFKIESLYSPEALGEACRLNNIQLVKYFFETMDIPKQDIRNGFCRACEGGLVELISFLYEQIEDDDFSQYKEYPLHLAINNSRLEATKFLLNHGFQEQAHLTTALHVACSNQEKMNIVRLLQLHNKKDEHGFTPLHRAVISQQENVVNLLCENVHEINHIDKQGRTPLYYACQNKNQKIIKTLLIYKAKL